MRGRVISYRFGGHDRRPPQSAPEPKAELAEPVEDDCAADQTEAEIDPFAEDDALAAMDPEDFYRQLRAQVEKLKSGELAGGVEDAHPLQKQRARSKRYKRRDKHGRAF